MTQDRTLIDIKNTDYQAEGNKKWVGTEFESTFMLDKLPYLTEKQDLIDETDKFSLEVHSFLTKLTLCEVMESALASKFHGQQLHLLDP